MKAALIDNQNNISNVIVWDETCTAPNGIVAVVVEDDVAVAPGWTYANGTFISPPDPPLPPTPSYVAFWNALLTSNVYGSIRTQSMISLPMNTLATEFIALIGDAKAGRPNETAIQSSISAIFSTGTFTEDDVEEFNNILNVGFLNDIYSLSIPTP